MTTRSVFIDSNVFIKHMEGFDEARGILEQLEEGRVKGYINDVVVSEVVYTYIVAVTGKRSYELKENPEILQSVDLTPVRKLLSLATLLPVTTDIASNMYSIITSYGLLPNDALIAATCRHYGITTIATFDHDFRRIPWLTVIP